jgi:hypothetical protein
LKNIFDEFKAIHVNDNKIVQFSYLNGRVLESQTAEEVCMEDEAHIKCFNFSNLFSKRDFGEMNCCNIYFHFALRLVDTDFVDEAVGVL